MFADSGKFHCSLFSDQSKTRLLAFVGILVVLTVFGCSSQRAKVNEENPFFIRGLELRQEGKYEDAVDAFKNCLKHSPGSHRAHLELALIYEDHFQDYPRALAHYETYLEAETEPGTAAVARKWQTRAEKKFYEILKVVYGHPAEGKDRVKSNRAADEELYLSAPLITDQGEHQSGTRQKLKPSGIDNQTGQGQPVVVESETDSTPAIATSIPLAEPEEIRYSIQPGDTLTSIANQFLGDSNRWSEIYDLNRSVLTTPHDLTVGEELVLPKPTREE